MDYIEEHHRGTYLTHEYLRLAHTAAWAGQSQRGQAYLDRVVPQHRGVRYLNACMRVALSSSRPQQVVQHFDELVRMGKPPDAYAYTYLLTAYETLGDAENTRRVAAEMEEKQKKRMALSA